MNSINRQEIINAINEDIASVKPSMKGKIQPADHLVNDCGLESLDLVELVARIESRFRVPIDDDQYRQLSSVNSIADFILVHSETMPA